MEHFSEQAWADFVRAINKSETNTDIESHLARGCSDCKAAFNIWNQVRTTITNEKTYTPPDNALRMVKQEFAARYSPEQRPSVLASLLFDTFAQPLPTGVRSGAAVARQLVYEAEGLTVDLRLDPRPQSNKICVVGQVLDRGVPRVSPSGASIMIWTEKGQPILQVSANESGEFQLEFDAQDDLRLSIDVAGRKTIRIPLANLGPSNVAG
jgi:hypothetical protein